MEYDQNMTELSQVVYGLLKIWRTDLRSIFGDWCINLLVLFTFKLL